MILPHHVAIIMDGNGRWAKDKQKPRFFGHREGMKRVKEIVEFSKKKGIKVLTLFAFSSENWFRPKEEIKFLISLLEEYIKKEVKHLKKNNIKIKFIGDLKKLPEKSYNLVLNSEKETEDCSAMILNIALSYGGKQEILEAVKKIAYEYKQNKISLDDINEEKFNYYLYTKGLPEPDLLIRTSGEMRISNFMLWQLAYTELYFTRTLWPDFTPGKFENALTEYAQRERRFGKISEQLNNI